MNRILKIFAVVVILSALTAPAAQAGNDQRRGTAGASELLINPWARRTGWGGVNIANVRGIDAMFNNVAGLAFLDNIEVSYTNTMLYGGVRGLNSGASINALGLGIRLFDRGVMGISLMSMGFGDIEKTTVESPEPINGTFSPTLMNINVAYSHIFTASIRGGVNIKIISESTDNISASGFAIDAGIQYVTGANDELKFGISLKNWGPAFSYDGTGLSFTFVNNAGNNMTAEFRSSNMELPTCLNIGISYDFLFEALSQRLSVAGAFTSNAFLKDNFSLGLEYSMLNMFNIRCGYIYQTGLCAGASVDVPLSKKGSDNPIYLTIDYSYRTSANLRGTHAIGGTFRF